MLFHFSCSWSNFLHLEILYKDNQGNVELQHLRKRYLDETQKHIRNEEAFDESAQCLRVILSQHMPWQKNQKLQSLFPVFLAVDSRAPSFVWNYFIRKGKEISTCSICGKDLINYNSTTSLRNHLNRKHHIIGWTTPLFLKQSFPAFPLQLIPGHLYGSTAQRKTTTWQLALFVEKTLKPRKAPQQLSWDISTTCMISLDSTFMDKPCIFSCQVLEKGLKGIGKHEHTYIFNFCVKLTLFYELVSCRSPVYAAQTEHKTNL